MLLKLLSFVIFFAALNGNLDDPDLLISFGDLRSFHGYQPWAVRLTEIM